MSEPSSSPALETPAPVTPADREYRMIIGGLVLVHRGKVIAAAKPAVVYDDLAYKHVQQIWQTALGDEQIQSALEQVAEATADAFVRLGNEVGLATGKLTRQEYEYLISTSPL